ncbi:MAG: hypothetical protein IT288_18095 [Bdellovibrionales bacterium]|nr:hypothetical protein [Bdellovibrionales bacterium]
MPPNWDCALEGTEWVCVSSFQEKSREAIIILTAKEAGPSDTLQAYVAHLKTSRTIMDPMGKPFQSQVVGAKTWTINNHMWVDSIHMGSEVTSYYTRYLATVKESIAILVTFSAHKAHYTKYSGDFMKAIQSLSVVASKNLLAQTPLTAPRGSSETFGAPIGQVLPTNMGEEVPPESSGSGKMGSSVIGLLILGLAVGYYLLFMRKKKRKGLGE